MKILVLDTASSRCGAAVFDAKRQDMLAERLEDLGKGHAEVLMDYVQQVIEASSVPLSEISRVAVNIGPGSFTGVRIGVAAARGFALALRCPVIGVTAFQALADDARQGHQKRPVLVLLDAHRGEIYSQCFGSGGEAEAAPNIWTREEAMRQVDALSGDVVLAGSAATAINAVLGDRYEVAAPFATGQLATYARIGATMPAHEVARPLYMRGPDVKPQTGFALPRRTAEDERHD